jgi:glutamate 5-kinase
VILTDQAGLYDADPRKSPGAKLLPEVEAGDPRLETFAGGAGSETARGGMLTKVLAAKRAARSGAHTVVASGHEPDVLVRLHQGEAIGTRFRAATTPMAARKQWLANHLRVAGRLHLDQGAVQALSREGKSLLPIGVTAVEGEFLRGEVVACVSPDGTEVARGLANYGATDARRIAGKSSSQIETLLGYVGESELIHRDNLVRI